VQFVHGGARSVAIGDFELAIQTHPASWNILLIDSEGPDDGKLFARLRLHAAQEDSVFWMVQLMESWFLADIQALKRYFGQGLSETRLRGNRAIEQIPKKDVLSRLKDATRTTLKQKYDKAEDAPHLLRQLDPTLVRNASPHCQRIFTIVGSRLRER
jgi:hypothetical protein